MCRPSRRPSPSARRWSAGRAPRDRSGCRSASACSPARAASSTVPAGSAANALLFGAKTVNGPGPCRVSTRPAACDRGDERRVVGRVHRVLDDGLRLAYIGAPPTIGLAARLAPAPARRKAAAAVILRIVRHVGAPGLSPRLGGGSGYGAPTEKFRRGARCFAATSSRYDDRDTRGRRCWTTARSNELLGRCALGDRRALRAALRRGGAETLRREPAYPRHRGDAEEATQEAFVKIWQSAGRYPGRARQRAGLDRRDRAQRRDRPAARPQGADPRHRRHGRPRRPRPDARGERGGVRRPAPDRGLPRAAARRTGRWRCGPPTSRGTATTSWRGTSTCRSTPCGPGCGGR